MKVRVTEMNADSEIIRITDHPLKEILESILNQLDGKAENYDQPRRDVREYRVDILEE